MNSNRDFGSTATIEQPDRGFLTDSGAAIAIRVVRTLEEVEAIREIWSSWRSHRDCDIDFCLEFVWASMEFIRPHVIVIYRDGQPDAMLVGRLEYAQKDWKLGYLRLPGIKVRQLTFAYRGLLGNASAENSREFIKSILNSLKDGEADVASLIKLAAGSDLYQEALTFPSFVSRDYLTKFAAHHIMRLPESTEQMYQGFSQGLRAEVRRKKKKILADFGDTVQIRRFQDPAELESFFPDLEEIAKKTYQRRIGVGFQDTEQMRRRLWLCAERGWLHIYILSLRGQPCAFWMGTLYDWTFYSDEIGYDPKFSPYSPGTFLLTTIVEDLCNAGVREVDFGVGKAEYKERFGNRHLEEASVGIFAPKPKGIALNLARTAAGVIESGLKKALDYFAFLQKIKRYWRSRLSSQPNQTAA
jgi:hypothetical protein